MSSLLPSFISLSPTFPLFSYKGVCLSQIKYVGLPSCNWWISVTLLMSKAWPECGTPSSLRNTGSCLQNYMASHLRLLCSWNSSTFACVMIAFVFKMGCGNLLTFNSWNCLRYQIWFERIKWLALYWGHGKNSHGCCGWLAVLLTCDHLLYQPAQCVCVACEGYRIITTAPFMSVGWLL